MQTSAVESHQELKTSVPLFPISFIATSPSILPDLPFPSLNIFNVSHAKQNEASNTINDHFPDLKLAIDPEKVPPNMNAEISKILQSGDAAYV